MTSSGDTAASDPDPVTTHRLLFGAVAIGWIALDQLSKWWVVSSLGDDTIDLVGSLRLRLAINYGAPFRHPGATGTGDHGDRAVDAFTG
ncbi:MAG: hypothetical protein ACKOIA_06090, partial [Acidimicrobiia bacterium]